MVYDMLPAIMLYAFALGVPIKFIYDAYFKRAPVYEPDQVYTRVYMVKRYKDGKELR